MICHDIPGGHNEDPICFNDSSKSYAYRFNHWQNIDTFIYFGHYRLTIPPTQWINTAHRNGVKILGTLIFEWDEGKKETQHMLDGKVTYCGSSKFYTHESFVQDQSEVNKEDLGTFYYAEKLVEIAKHFGFDGYLMNFEADVPKDKVASLIDWLGYLRMRLKDDVGMHAEMIWYDSVVEESGKVRWQSALNYNNNAFFEQSDGIFTDYHW